METMGLCVDSTLWTSLHVERRGNRDTGTETTACMASVHIAAPRMLPTSEQFKTKTGKHATKWVEPRKRGEHDRIGSKSSLYRTHTHFSGNKHTHRGIQKRSRVAREFASAWTSFTASTHGPNWANQCGR